MEKILRLKKTTCCDMKKTRGKYIGGLYEGGKPPSRQKKGEKEKNQVYAEKKTKLRKQASSSCSPRVTCEQ